MRPYIPQKIFTAGKYAIIILNREIKLNPKFFAKIWEQALIRHTVDGGSNHLHNFYNKSQTDKTGVKLPDITSGDFDSIDQDVMEFLKKEGRTEIILTEDQNETDFTKGLQVLNEFICSKNLVIENIIALVEPSGRLDQTMGNFQTLHKNPFGESIHLYLMSLENLTWLLPRDTNSIIEFQPPLLETKCGIIPLNGPTKIKSQGLKWELNDEVYNFGGTVSTSNQVVSSCIKIEPKVNPVLFTLEMKEDDYN